MDKIEIYFVKTQLDRWLLVGASILFCTPLQFGSPKNSPTLPFFEIPLTAVVSDDFSGVLKVGDDLKYIQFVATEYVADRILA